MIVKGRESVFWKACAELCRVVGSAKTRIRKFHSPKATKKSGFSFPTFPCVSAQTIFYGFHHFKVDQTRVSGFGLKCTGILLSRSCGKFALFYQCLQSADTGKKMGRGVFWISTAREFQAKPLNTGRAFYGAMKPVCKGLA